MFRRSAASRSVANSRCARRLPTFEPKAIATEGMGKVRSLAKPARSQHSIAGAGAVHAPPEQVVTAEQHLVEEALVLQRLAERQVQHVPVPRVGHLAREGPPAR